MESQEKVDAAPSALRCSSSHYPGVTLDAMEILEREDHVEMGGGFSLCRREGGWGVYYKCKHVDAWIEEHTGEDVGMRMFGSVKDAFEVVKTLIDKPIEEWVNDAD